MLAYVSRAPRLTLQRAAVRRQLDISRSLCRSRRFAASLTCVADFSFCRRLARIAWRAGEHGRLPKGKSPKAPSGHPSPNWRSVNHRDAGAPVGVPFAQQQQTRAAGPLLTCPLLTILKFLARLAAGSGGARSSLHAAAACLPAGCAFPASVYMLRVSRFAASWRRNTAIDSRLSDHSLTVGRHRVVHCLLRERSRPLSQLCRLIIKCYRYLNGSCVWCLLLQRSERQEWHLCLQLTWRYTLEASVPNADILPSLVKARKRILLSTDPFLV